MKQRADDDEPDHPKDLADAADALRLAVSNKRKDVWTWLRLAVFFGSLVANAGFWFYTRHLENKVRIADYNDRSWAAYESFDESLTKLEAAQKNRFEDLFREGVKATEPLRILDAEWMGAITLKVTELSSKLAAYRSACDCSLLAIDAAKKEVASLLSPAQRVKIRGEDATNDLIKAIVRLGATPIQAKVMKEQYEAEAKYQLDLVAPQAAEDARLLQNAWKQ